MFVVAKSLSSDTIAGLAMVSEQSDLATTNIMVLAFLLSWEKYISLIYKPVDYQSCPRTMG